MTKYGLSAGPISTVESKNIWECSFTSSRTFTYNNIVKCSDMLGYVQIWSDMFRYVQICSYMFRYGQIRHKTADNLGAKKNFIKGFKDMTSQLIKV